MLFQALDDKQECIGIYLDGKLIFDELPDNLTKTWNYSKFLEDRDIEYAKLYCFGKTLSEVCPEHLKERWEEANERMKAFYRSFMEAKVSLRDNCFFDLVPERHLMAYCDIKDRITDYVLRNYEKPKNYDHLLSTLKIATDIKTQNLDIDASKVTVSPKTRNLLKKVRSSDTYVNYNIFGTKTGRLTTINGSFPILTIKKELRTMIKPQNDCFLELDFNAAELRTVLALLGKEQPPIDLHKWNNKNAYKGILTREKAKKRIFAWLYNPNSKDALSEKFYDRGKIKENFFNGKEIETVFNRKIKADDYHAFNYIIQSTSSDLFLEQVSKVHNYLRGKKSSIAFMIHDSLIIDFDRNELNSLKELVRMFSQTRFGEYLVNLHVGKDFGTMKEWKL